MLNSIQLKLNQPLFLRAIFFILILIIYSSLSFSQERLTPLKNNSAVEFVKLSTTLKKNLSDTLPFFDDFSDSFVLPSQDRWTDRLVFINNGFPINPLSLGVATFDGLNGFGKAYKFGILNVYGIADTLTSIPLKLGKYQLGDSINLSFYIQPQGKSFFSPAAKDSFLVDFKNPITNTWNRVYKIKGSSFTNFRNLYNTDFLLVNITIKDSAFLKDGFQFRFMNYANRTGNNDHWHLDYVKLDRKDGNPNNLNDIAISSFPESILIKYESMPWNQVNSTDLKGTGFDIRNNFTDPKSLTNIRYFPIDAQTGNILFTYPGEGLLLNPLSIQNKTYGTFPLPPFNNELRKVINLKVDLQNSADLYPQNDTVLRKQNFYNYYAYDDGSAEANYGLESTGSRLAYQFQLNNPDTLRAVDMFFTQLDKDVSQRTFSIAIWKDLISPPIDTFINKNPQYSGSLDGFVRYDLARPVVLSGTFYVGWIQNSIDQLNIGFDANKDNSQYIFKNTTGIWDNTLFPGSIMIRPIFSESTDLVSGINEISEIGKLKVFPNPVSEILTFESPNQNEIQLLSIFNLNGQLIYQTESLENQNINVSEFKSGLYFIDAKDKSGRIFRSKFIKLNSNE